MVAALHTEPVCAAHTSTSIEKEKKKKTVYRCTLMSRYAEAIYIAHTRLYREKKEKKTAAYRCTLMSRYFVAHIRA